MKKLLIIIFCIMFVASLQAKTSKDTTNNKKAKTKKTNKKSSHDSNKGWYLGSGIGIIVSNPTIFRTYHGYTSFPDYEIKVNKSITLNAGYTFFPWFALEGEFNRAFNNEDSNRYYDGTKKVNNYYENQFDSVYLNTVFKYTFKKKHTPFIKLGLGYSNYKQNQIIRQEGSLGSISYYNFDNSYKNLGTHFAVGYEYAINYNSSIAISYDIYNLFENSSYISNDIEISEPNHIVPNYTITHKEIKIQYKYSFK